VLIYRKPELARRRSMEQLGVGKATPGVVIWRVQWASPGATAMTIQNQFPKRGCSFH